MLQRRVEEDRKAKDKMLCNINNLDSEASTDNVPKTETPAAKVFFSTLPVSPR